ncbi:MAG: DNA recombination protein RmuC [Rhodobacteraceae bacterium]|nr:DNA recombination protein RmuC [Paracoccaceae bacterium]
MSLEIVLISMLVLINIALTILVLTRSGKAGGAPESLHGEFRGIREENATAAKQLREEVVSSQSRSTETLTGVLTKIGEMQSGKLMEVRNEVKTLTDRNESRIGRLTEQVGEQLGTLRDSNEEKLEKMRETVEEKLQGTLEKRLGESFKLVSERLEAVQKGLGEMQELATGVGDLKAVLTNVKTRGNWGEIQLGALLEQVLAPTQYVSNAMPNPQTREIVEYAIKLPGPDNDDCKEVLLPIDAKFPQEDYNRLIDASECGDAEAAQQASKGLLRSVEKFARDIRSKYVLPPHTTDFAILYLPTEGLYAEIVRSPVLLEKLQREFRVVVAGPTTLAAILNSLQMGFRTLAIEKRSSEVWTVLSAVKTEFGKFGDVLDKVKKQVATVSATLEKTDTRRRVMDRTLREVEEMPVSEDMRKRLGIEDAEQVRPSLTIE